MRKQWRGLVGVAVGVAVLVASSGCQASSSGSAAPSTTVPANGEYAVSPSDATRVALAAATVDVPVGAVKSAGTISARQTDDKPPDGLHTAGPAVDVHLSGTTLQTPAEVTWTLAIPSGVEPSAFEPFVVSVGDDGTIGLVDSTWDPGTRTLSAKPTHFSLQIPSFPDLGRIGDNVINGLKSYLTGRANVAAPTCDREPEARASGLSPTSSDGDIVKWCFGMDGDQRILKVVNNRSAPVIVTYSTVFEPRDIVGGGLSFESLGRWVSSMAPPAQPDTELRVLGSSETFTLDVKGTVPPDSHFGADLEMDIFSWAFAGFDVAVDAVGGPVSVALGKKLKKSDVAAEAFAESSELLNCMRTRLTADLDPRGRVGETPSFGEDAVKATQIGLDCGLNFIKEFVKRHGGNTAAKVVAVVVGAAVGFVRSGGGLITAAVRDAVDLATGNAVYKVRLTQPAAEPPAQPSTRPGGPPGGLDCGADSTDAQWQIVAANMSCADAQRIVKLYHEAPDKQGSSGNATVDGYACGSDARPVYEFGAYGACKKDSAGAYLYPTTPPAPEPTPVPRGEPITGRAASTDGIGPVKLGITPQAAAAATGLPLTASPCSGSWELGTDLGLATDRSNQITVITTASPTIATKSGVSVGMTAAQVRAALPDVESQASYDEPILIVRSGDREVVFDFRNGKVSAITVAVGTLGENPEHLGC